MTRKKRIFTLREAQALLPQVRALTTAAFQRAESLQEEMEGASEERRRTELAGVQQTVVRDWARDVEALGCEVKGLWLVDFDSGDGLYYCWQHPEAQLEFFHDYDTGFAGRRPLGGLLVN
jgi:hypothetical protein